MAFIDDVMVDRIAADARQVEFRRVLLTVLAAVFFAIGWCAAKLCGALWLAAAWSVTAVRVGWQEGRNSGARPRPQ